MAQNASATNLANSKNLEAQYFPGLASARNQSYGVTQQMLTPTNQGLNTLENSTTATIQKQLNDANAGVLPKDVQNQVQQQALEGGQGSGVGLGAGQNGMSARDLGLTSYQMQQNALNNANTNVSNELTNQYRNQATATGQLYSQPLPASGLSPGDLASLAVANNNNSNNYALGAANIAGQNSSNNYNFLTGLLGSIPALL
jgi:hypothetical protein